jgi:hypothetical protein
MPRGPSSINATFLLPLFAFLPSLSRLIEAGASTVYAYVTHGKSTLVPPCRFSPSWSLTAVLSGPAVANLNKCKAIERLVVSANKQASKQAQKQSNKNQPTLKHLAHFFSLFLFTFFTFFLSFAAGNQLGAVRGEDGSVSEDRADRHVAHPCRSHPPHTQWRVRLLPIYPCSALMLPPNWKKYTKIKPFN